MELSARIHSFESLGQQLISFIDSSNQLASPLLQSAVTKAAAENTWFTESNIRTSLKNIGSILTGEKIQKWLEPYYQKLLQNQNSKSVAVVMAGNIPAVGFHDFLCVLMAGHRLTGRLSSQDSILIPCLAEMLNRINPLWKEYIRFTRDQIERHDALIATGNDNTFKYFDYYFRNVLNIIRKNRNSVAILTGTETSTELECIADDALLYFGLGCRSVSKIFVPDGYDFTDMLKAVEKYAHYLHHPKYNNNYTYNKSIYQVNGIPVIDNGFLLLKEDSGLVSRIACLNYEYYEDVGKVYTKLKADKEKLQCVVGPASADFRTLQPGKTQKPELWDYADDIDTMQFLLEGI